MSDFEIPLAAETTNSNTCDSEYEQQKKACFEAISKINENCASSSIILKACPQEKLIKELEEKGYRVNYTLDYDSGKETKYLCKLRIINPKYKDAGTDFMASIEDNLKNFGFNKASLETEEKFKQLLNNLMGF